MSTDYSKMSDFEINLRVAEILVDYDCISRLPYTDMAVHWGDGANWHVFNPCNNPADSWPIITENNIAVVPYKHTIPQAWPTSFGLVSKFTTEDRNPLRAAMITFLKMQEPKNAS